MVRYLWRFYENFRGLWFINHEIDHFGYFCCIQGRGHFLKIDRKTKNLGFYPFCGIMVAIFCPNNRRLKIDSYWEYNWVIMTILRFEEVPSEVYPQRYHVESIRGPIQKAIFLEQILQDRWWLGIYDVFMKIWEVYDE